MAYVSSAGIARGAPGYGTTCRKDVLGGVEVPVMPGATGRAPVRSVCQRSWRAARVRFHTTRTQPNVRFSTACCAWSG